MRETRAGVPADDAAVHSRNPSTIRHASRAWRDVVADYAKPETRRGVIQLLNTILPFAALMAAMLYGLEHGVWLILALAVPAAGLLVRMFAIQHDCGHGSFFKSRWANDLLGRSLGVLTLTPYDWWRRSHATHHATSGNLDRRGVGDIDTLTVREYFARSVWRRLSYRLYRHPLVLFGVGPIYLFFIRHRIPSTHPLRAPRDWLSVIGTNAAIAALVTAMALTVGLGPFLLAFLPVSAIGAAVGVWLFYVQHQFEDTYWSDTQHWSFRAAALEGCSYYDLPRVLHWFTGHIGLHHIHHLSSRIPNYRLRACFERHTEFHAAKRLTLWDSFRCARLALWDEDRRKLVSFRDARATA